MSKFVFLTAAKFHRHFAKSRLSNPLDLIKKEQAFACSFEWGKMDSNY